MPTSTKSKPIRKAKPTFSLEDRIEHGSLTVSEVLTLAQVSRTKFYADVKTGVVVIFKRGRSTRIQGCSAKLYIAGNINADAGSSANE